MVSLVAVSPWLDMELRRLVQRHTSHGTAIRWGGWAVLFLFVGRIEPGETLLSPDGEAVERHPGPPYLSRPWM